MHILIISTSHDLLVDSSRKTGLWLHEIAIPYYLFKESGAMITLASIKGGLVPIDPKSESIIAATSITKKFSKDQVANSILINSVPIFAQKAVDFDMVLLLGGHGALWDFYDNPFLKKIIEEFNQLNKFIGAIGHGVAGLLSPINPDGKKLISGRRLTAFTNQEEQISKLESILPYSLETSLISLGAVFTKNLPFTSHLCIDGNIITGQNPASAMALANQLLYSQGKRISQNTKSISTN